MPRPGRPFDRVTAGLAAVSWLAAAVTYLLAEGLAAIAFSPPYSYARNYISDLGVPDCGAIFDGRAICSPLHLVVNSNFVLQGVLFLIAALAIARSLASPARFVLIAVAAINAIGIGLVGIFPESAATKPGDTLKYHALGALLAIVAGNTTALLSAVVFADLRLPRIHRWASVALPLLGAFAFAMLLSARARGTMNLLPDGVWERTSVYTITAWELLTAACVMARARPDP